MAFQSVPNTAEIDHIFTLHGITVQNVYYARLPAGYSLSDLQALADAIDLLFPTTFVNDMSVDVSYVRTEVRGLNVENDLVATQALSAGPGTDASAAYPSQVTFSIKKGSGLTGRSARGRTFWIGIPRNKIEAADENKIIATYVVSIVADVDFVRTTIATVGLWEPVLVSRFANKVKRPTGTTFPWTTTTNVDVRVDTQRGRLPD